MKDGERVWKLWSRLEGLRIIRCPKCEHEVIAKGIAIDKWHPTDEKLYGNRYTCLVCGSKLSFELRCELNKEDE